jgi:hypothetical protein
MSATRGAAALEEQAELRILRDEADRSAAEAARTLAELTGRLAVVGHPGKVARRMAAGARVTALRALREGPGRIAGQRGAWRPALAAIPVLALAAALAYAAARGKLRTEKSASPGSSLAGLPARLPQAR